MRNADIVMPWTRDPMTARAAPALHNGYDVNVEVAMLGAMKVAASWTTPRAKTTAAFTEIEK